MKHFAITLAAASAMMLSLAVAAQQEQDEEEEQARAPQTDVLVKEEAGQQVVETRIEGRLESVRVKPRIGPEYFIQDRGGDGTLSATGGGEMDSSFNIRTWKLGEW